jgi:hypothetical protein
VSWWRAGCNGPVCHGLQLPRHICCRGIFHADKKSPGWSPGLWVHSPWTFWQGAQRKTVVIGTDDPGCGFKFLGWEQGAILMPIRPYLAGRTFAPEIIVAMSAALEEACRR